MWHLEEPPDVSIGIAPGTWIGEICRLREDGDSDASVGDTYLLQEEEGGDIWAP